MGVLGAGGGGGGEGGGGGGLGEGGEGSGRRRVVVAPSHLRLVVCARCAVIDLVCIPTFADIEIDGEGRTAIRLAVEDRARRQSTEEQGNAAAPSPPRNGTYRPLYPAGQPIAPPVLTT